MSKRIPFAEAIQEKRLLEPHFWTLSMFQQTWLKVMYGCELDAKHTDDNGYTELDYWAASQDSATWDRLGYLKAVHPLKYTPKEYKEVWGICGVRAGKTDKLAATIVAYEAICGGHEDFGSKDRPKICFQIAQDIRMAKYSLHSIMSVLKSMKFLHYGTKESWVTNSTADRIELKNNIHIMVTPPTAKSVRGYDSPVAVLDEVGVWYQDADSANPDFEIYQQVDSRQAQFEHPKIVGISSPWNRGGLLFDRWEAGTEGSRIRCNDCRMDGKWDDTCKRCKKARLEHAERLVLYSPTAASNPIISRNWLVTKFNKSPRSFDRECMARFQDSLSGFLSAPLIEAARCQGVMQREPDKKFFYIAAIDPAFKRDAFAFTIVHCDPELGIVQDYVKRWKGQEGNPVNPAEVFNELAGTLAEYKIKTVFSDQHSFEALNYIAQQHGFGIEQVTFSSNSKADIYGNLQQLLNQNKIKLLDDQDTINELKSIERFLLPGGNIRISAPEGKHDDLATVVAIAAHEGVWMLPNQERKKAEAPKSFVEKHIEHLTSKRRRIADPVFDW